MLCTYTKGKVSLKSIKIFKKKNLRIQMSIKKPRSNINNNYNNDNNNNNYKACSML